METFRTQTIFSFFFSERRRLFDFFFETVPSGAKPEPTQPLLDPAAFPRRWISFRGRFRIRCVHNLGDSESIAICALYPELGKRRYGCVPSLVISTEIQFFSLPGPETEPSLSSQGAWTVLGRF